MNYEQTLVEVSKYLCNDSPYTRIPDVEQYTHFVKGVYMVQTKGVRFSPDFYAWLDEKQIFNVSLLFVTGNIYTILVRK